MLVNIPELLTLKHGAAEMMEYTREQEVIPYAKINQKCQIKSFLPKLSFRENRIIRFLNK